MEALQFIGMVVLSGALQLAALAILFVGLSALGSWSDKKDKEQ